MDYDEDRRSGCGAILTAVALMLVVGILVVALAAFFFLSTRQSQRAEEIARMQAEDAMQAAVEAEQSRLLAEAEPESGQPNVEVRIDVDQEGTITLDDQLTPLEDLDRKLRRYDVAHGESLSLVVHVDPQCRFEHLQDLLRICADMGLDPQLVTDP